MVEGTSQPFGTNRQSRSQLYYSSTAQEAIDAWMIIQSGDPYKDYDKQGRLEFGYRIGPDKVATRHDLMESSGVFMVMHGRTTMLKDPHIATKVFDVAGRVI